MQLPKELTTVTPLSKLVALILFILLPFIGFLFGDKYQTMKVSNIVINDVKPTPSLVLKPTGITPIQASANQAFPKEITIGGYNQLEVNNQSLTSVEGIFSPNKQYMFFYDAQNYYQNNNFCDFAIYKKQGKIYSFFVSGAEKISCSAGMGISTQSFYTWTDNTHFLIQAQKGTIKLYDVLAFNTPRILFTYDPKTINFVGVNDVYSQWLMLKLGEKDKTSLFMSDSNNKALSGDIIFINSDIEHLLFGKLVPYDKINKGFVLITRHYNNSNDTTWGEFYFLSVIDFQLKKIKTGKPSKTLHMGCGGFDYEIKHSKSNEIYLVPPSCLTINNADIESDGTVKLTL